MTGHADGASRHRRGGGDPARRARRPDLLGEPRRRSVLDQRVAAGPLGPGAVLRPDPKAPDKTYSKIGGWVRDWTWDPLGWKLPIPPRVGDAMDDGQKWAVACTRAALLDYG